MSHDVWPGAAAQKSCCVRRRLKVELQPDGKGGHERQITGGCAARSIHRSGRGRSLVAFGQADAGSDKAWGGCPSLDLGMQLTRPADVDREQNLVSLPYR